MKRPFWQEGTILDTLNVAVRLTSESTCCKQLWRVAPAFDSPQVNYSGYLCQGHHRLGLRGKLLGLTAKVDRYTILRWLLWFTLFSYLTIFWHYQVHQTNVQFHCSFIRGNTCDSCIDGKEQSIHIIAVHTYLTQIYFVTYVSEILLYQGDNIEISFALTYM